MRYKKIDKSYIYRYKLVDINILNLIIIKIKRINMKEDIIKVMIEKILDW